MNRRSLSPHHLPITCLACLGVGLGWLVLPHPLLAVVLGLLPLAAIFVLRQSFFIILMFVIFSFFRLHEVFPALYSLKIPLLLSLASLAALAWHLGLTRRLQLYWRPELTVLGLFFFWVLLGTLLASNRPVAFEYLKGIYWKIALMTFAIAWLSRDERDFALSGRLIPLAGLLVALVALANKFRGIDLVEGSRVTIGRALGSVLGDPNDLALVLMFPLSFAISLMLERRLDIGTRLLGWICTPVLIAAIIATQSRGGLLGLLAIIACYGYRQIRSKVLLTGLGAAALLLLYVAAGISDRASGGAAEAGIDASAMGRIYAWQAAFKMALDNPLSGVGLNNFYANYFYYSPHWDGLNHAVHSTWFGVLAETGFVGLLLFIATMAMLLRTAWRSQQRIEARGLQVSPSMVAASHSMLTGLVGIIVSGTFLTQGFTWPLYILAALIVALARWLDEQQDAPRGEAL